VIKPFFGDQYFWANRVTELGVGVGIRRLEVDALAAALTRITTDERMLARANIIGEKIRAEDGVGTAIAHIHRNVEYHRSRSDSDTNTAPISPPSKNIYQSLIFSATEIVGDLAEKQRRECVKYSDWR
jgi:hypothetical protein